MWSVYVLRPARKRKGERKSDKEVNSNHSTGKKEEGKLKRKSTTMYRHTKTYRLQTKVWSKILEAASNGHSPLTYALYMWHLAFGWLVSDAMMSFLPFPCRVHGEFLTTWARRRIDIVVATKIWDEDCSRRNRVKFEEVKSARNVWL